MTAKITMPCGQCTGQTNGTACNDANPCTGTSTCQSQKCTGGTPMSCSASRPVPRGRRVQRRDRRLLEAAQAQRHRAAATATPAPRRTPASRARAPARTRSRAPRRTSATWRGRATRRRACARTRPRPTGRPATTATRARRRTPASPARAPGGNPVTCTASGPVPRGGDLQSGDGRLLESDAKPTGRPATTATRARRRTRARRAPAPAATR